MTAHQGSSTPCSNMEYVTLRILKSIISSLNPQQAQRFLEILFRFCPSGAIVHIDSTFRHGHSITEKQEDVLPEWITSFWTSLHAQHSDIRKVTTSSITSESKSFIKALMEMINALIPTRIQNALNCKNTSTQTPTTSPHSEPSQDALHHHHHPKWAMQYAEKECHIPPQILEQLQSTMHDHIPLNLFKAKVQLHDDDEDHSSDDEKDKEVVIGFETPESLPPTPMGRLYYSRKVEVYTSSLLQKANKTLQRVTIN